MRQSALEAMSRCLYHQERSTDHAAGQRKLPVRARIQRPRSVEKRVSPEQCCSCDAGHGGSKERKTRTAIIPREKRGCAEPFEAFMLLTIPE